MINSPDYSTLHKNILIHTFSYLDIRDICTSARVCKRWYQIVKDPNSLWKLIYQQKKPTKDLKFKHLHLDKFNKTFFDRIKNSIIFSKNISTGTYTYQEVPGFLHINKYLYNIDERTEFHENKVIEIFDTRLGASCKIKNQHNMPMKISFTYPDRLVTMHRNPKSKGRIESVWDIHSSEPMKAIDLLPGRLARYQYIQKDKSSDDYLIYRGAWTKDRVKVCHIKIGKLWGLDRELSAKINSFFLLALADWSIWGKELLVFNGFNKIFKIDVETQQTVAISVHCQYERVHIIGSYIIACPKDEGQGVRELHRWNSLTGKPCPHLEVSGNSYFIYKNFLVIIQKSKVRIFDVNKNYWVYELNQDDIEDGALLPILNYDRKENVLITVSKQKINAWCITTGQLFYSFTGSKCEKNIIFTEAQKNHVIILGPKLNDLHILDLRNLVGKNLSVPIKVRYEEGPLQTYFARVITIVRKHLVIALQNTTETVTEICIINIDSGKKVKEIFIDATIADIERDEFEAIQFVGHSLIIRRVNKEGNPVTQIYQFGVPFQIPEKSIEEPEPKNKKCIIC